MERRDELEAYVGPNAGAYLAVFDRFQPQKADGYALSWNWPAFFCGVWWYLYRKMYLWAAVDFALSVVLGWTFLVPLFWAVIRALTGNYLYFLQADRKIREAAAYPAGDADPARLARLAREGGVHRWVAWSAVVGVVLLTAAAFLFFHLLLEMVPAIQEHWPADGWIRT